MATKLPSRRRVNCGARPHRTVVRSTASEKTGNGPSPGSFYYSAYHQSHEDTSRRPGRKLAPGTKSGQRPRSLYAGRRLNRSRNRPIDLFSTRQEIAVGLKAREVVATKRAPGRDRGYRRKPCSKAILRPRSPPREIDVRLRLRPRIDPASVSFRPGPASDSTLPMGGLIVRCVFRFLYPEQAISTRHLGKSLIQVFPLPSWPERATAAAFSESHPRLRGSGRRSRPRPGERPAARGRRR